ncbi:MAG: AAA family ATPase [Bacillota bacterium]
MEIRQEGETVSLILASHDSNWMIEVAQELAIHYQIRVTGFAQSGESAIIRVTSMVADAVLMDYSMVDINALEVVQRLAEESPGTAVFVIAENTPAQLIQASKAKGIVEIFPKAGFVGREAGARIAEHVNAQRREWAQAAQKHGIVEKGTGPRGNGKAQEKYVAKPVTQTVILTHNMKGGVGKSTIAVNLAVAIKMSPYFSGQRVVLADFDPGGANVATICHIPDTETYKRNLSTWEYIPEDLSAREVDDLLIPGPGGVMICAAPLSVAASEKITVGLADQVLRILKRYYGIIVIDGAPNISPPIDAAMHHATHVLLVANPEGQSVKQLARTVQLVSPDPDFPEKTDLSSLLQKMLVVINHAQADSRWNLKSGDIAVAIGRPVIAEIPNDEAVKQALHGKANKQAGEMDESHFAIAIKTLANDLCGAYPEGVGQYYRNKTKTRGTLPQRVAIGTGFLGRLFRRA